MNDTPHQSQLILPEKQEARETATAARALAPVSQATSEAGAFLAMVERAARDPSVDLDKLERLMAMREREQARAAKAEFAAAFADMIPALPTIDRNGGIVLYSKSDRDYAAKNEGNYPPNARPIQTTKYATLDDILIGINPVLSEYGFSIRFEHETAPIGDSYRIKTRAILTHRAGHSESAETPPLLQDSSGSKNNVQGVGSSMKYGRRYALMAILPIASQAPQDADDDGEAAGQKPGPTVISQEQLAAIDKKLTDCGTDRPTFLDYFDLDRLDDMPADKFDHAMSLIRPVNKERRK